MQKVAAVKVVNTYEDVEKGVNETLGLLGGLDKFISPGERVLLKPSSQKLELLYKIGDKN